MTIIDYLDKQVREKSESTALVFGNRYYSFATLDVITDALACELINAGIQKGNSIGVLVERSELIQILPLSIIKAGAIYTPLSTTYPKDRIKAICDDAGLKCLLTTKDRTDLDSLKSQITVLYYDEVNLKNRRVTGDCHFPEIRSNDNMIIYYTSGSTGKPRGVIHNHETVIAGNRYTCDKYGITGKDRLLSCVDTCYAFSIRMFQNIIAGAPLYIATKEQVADIHNLNEYINKHKITVTSLPTPIGHLFCQTIDVTSLRLMTVAGSTLPPVSKKLPYTLVSEYGCSEYISASLLDVKNDRHFGMIANPCPHTHFVVMCKEKEVEHIGEEGELWITGSCMAEGYVNDKDSDRKKFVVYKGHRYLKSGDIVRIAEGGYQYIGRNDSMVKINGVRVELSEIEKLLFETMLFSQICVCTKHINGVQKICVFYVPSQVGKRHGIDIDGIKQYLLRKVPANMIPFSFTKLDKLPLNEHGKIDYHALPAPDVSYVGNSLDDDGTDTKLNDVTECMRTIFRNNNISPDDNFYSVGGDSLYAMQLISMLKTKGWEISITDLKQEANAINIAGKLKAVNIKDITAEVGSVDSTPLLSYLLKANTNDAINHFIIPELLQGYEYIDAKIVQRSLDFMIRHHDMLRAVVSGDSLVIKEQNDEVFCTVDEIQLNEEYNSSMFDGITERFYSSFDIFNNGMLKALIIHLKDKELLLIGCNHVVSDSVSKKILCDDFCTLYKQIKNGETPNILLKTNSYKEYCKVLWNVLETSVTDYDYKYWEKVTENVDKSYTTSKGNIHKVCAAILDAKYVNELTILGYNLQSVIIAALALAMKTEENKDDRFVMQIMNHGRDIPLAGKDGSVSFERTIGLFPYCYPVAFDYEVSEDTHRFLEYVDNTIKSVPNKGLSYGLLHPQSPILQNVITLDYLGNTTKHSSSDADELTPAKRISHGKYYSETLSIGSNMIVFTSATERGMVFQAEYDSVLITETTVRNIVDSLIEQLKTLAHTFDKLH